MKTLVIELEVKLSDKVVEKMQEVGIRYNTKKPVMSIGNKNAYVKRAYLKGE